jgi:hypothetical protein
MGRGIRHGKLARHHVRAQPASPSDAEFDSSRRALAIWFDRCNENGWARSAQADGNRFVESSCGVHHSSKASVPVTKGIRKLLRARHIMI